MACFFLSGATSLVYQVVWLRMLGLIFGHTLYAVTTVLAAFMGGLAIGSFLVGRWAPRIRRHIEAYGWIEIAIGAYCAFIPAAIGVTSNIYLGLHHRLELSYDAFNLVQFLLVFSLLLLPTTLMGGTLPLLGQAIARVDERVGRSVGVLYAANTFGAVFGVAAAGYLLLPAFGSRMTLWLAVGGNLVVGLLAIVYARRSSAGAPPRGAPTHASADTPESTASDRRADLGAWLIAAALAVSGAVSMIYEVAWTRALALVIGSSTYAFTAMLIAFLVGIAGGSGLYSWVLGTRRRVPGVFAALQLGIGVAVLVGLLAFERMPQVFLAALRWSDSPGFVQGLQLGVSACVLLLSTLLIGATFPCAIAASARAEAVGRSIGRLYAANTLGAITGVILAGFLLIPGIGVHASIKAGVAVNLVIAGLLFIATPAWGTVMRGLGLGITVVAGVGMAWLPPWDLRVLTSGPAVYGQAYNRASRTEALPDLLRKREVLFYRDGRSSTVSVLRAGPDLSLQVNGKTDASTGAGDMATQLMLGHLPLLLHPDPHNVLVIGLGSGITAGAVARYPVARLDVAEIEPAVVQASHLFSEYNGRVLADRRTRAVIADARNFLLTSSPDYDVIISEPSNPWMSGLASLFSVEFFELVRSRLRPGGVMVQWIHGYSLFPDDLRMVVRTFRTVFPDTSIWSPGAGDFLLLGRTQLGPLDLVASRVRFERTPGVARELGQLGIAEWPGVLADLLLAGEDVATLVAGAGINTDDVLPLEFSTPRALYVDTREENWRLVRRFRTLDFPAMTPASRAEVDRPEVRHMIAMRYLRKNAPEEAIVQFERAFALAPGYPPSLIPAASALLRLGHPQEALRLARRALDLEPRSAEALRLAGLASESLGALEEARGFLERAFAADPQNAEARRALSRVEIRMLERQSGSRALPRP